MAASRATIVGPVPSAVPPSTSSSPSSVPASRATLPALLKRTSIHAPPARATVASAWTTLGVITSATSYCHVPAV